MSVISGILNSNATSDAADTMADAMADAADAQAEAAGLAADAVMYGSDAAANAAIQAAGIGAEALKESARIAADMQWKMYDQTRQDQLPWLTAGTKALGQLETKIAAGPGEFVEDPGYQFRLKEGNKNILAAGSATGSLASGKTLKALETYGQDYASNEYSNFINRYYQSLAPLQSLSGLGQSTATALGISGSNAANSASSSTMMAGTGLANIYGNLGNNLSSNYQNTGSNLANIYTNQGNNMANAYTNLGNINANAQKANAQTWSNTASSLESAILFGRLY